jgi:HEPN domain-containing protein
LQQPDNDIAEALVARADDDLSLVRIATAQLDIADAIVGFHAQQAAEKLLKALLSRRRVDYPLTHDVERLVELVEEATGARPPDADAIAALTPWAVEFRYGELADEVLDRDATLDRLQRLRAWAAELLSEPQQ